MVTNKQNPVDFEYSFSKLRTSYGHFHFFNIFVFAIINVFHLLIKTYQKTVISSEKFVFTSFVDHFIHPHQLFIIPSTKISNYRRDTVDLVIVSQRNIHEEHKKYSFENI